MSTTTARALMIGFLVALWAWLAGVARINVSLWAGVVALGCYLAAGGGIGGLQKTVVATLSGVIWVLAAHAVRAAIGGGDVVAAVILGAAVVGMVAQSRLTLLSFTAGALAGAGTALGLGVRDGNGAIRAAVALAMGALIGFLADRLAGLFKTRAA